ncbi:MAG: DUF4959 domain-containing protein [Bacteroidales bacterium]|jgi:hypothetical protein|nr:DUF4959 domain-containing protein [Bacteroidales bacterium]
MKKFISYWTVLILMFLVGCKDYEVGQFPVDNTPPQPVSDAVVENLPGRVKITYKLPNETDLLYVKAVYYNSLGVKMEVKASSFKNTIEIKGFGKSDDQTIHLIAVDRSQNESEALPVKIKPLDSPIYAVRETLQAVETWGGVKLMWENPSREQLIVKVLKDEDNEQIEIDTFYSTELTAENSTRGLDSIPQVFRIFIKDIYENTTDTLVTTIKPRYEMELPTGKFKEMDLGTDYEVSQYSNGWNKLWDGLYGVEGSMYYLNIKGNVTFSYFTIDLDATYKLSRTRVWGRTNYAYALHNPRYFEFWGTDDLDAARNKDSWDGWTRLIECESYKPSGSASGVVTSEDQIYAEAGEEFEFPDDVINVRYIRFRCNETWTKSKNLCIGELRFWGQEVKIK